ncbi:MAG: hypothetical protein Q8M18_17380, partial [Bradyrhizobium sp.]|nr:hypothetical protein [Bradyrhizobium sp.]
QSIASAVKRMTRINDLDLIAMRHVIVTLMDISRCPRLKASTGGCHNGRGAHRQLAERDIVNQCAIEGSQMPYLVIPFEHAAYA